MDLRVIFMEYLNKNKFSVFIQSSVWFYLVIHTVLGMVLDIHPCLEIFVYFLKWYVQWFIINQLYTILKIYNFLENFVSLSLNLYNSLLFTFFWYIVQPFVKHLIKLYINTYCKGQKIQDDMFTFSHDSHCSSASSFLLVRISFRIMEFFVSS